MYIYYNMYKSFLWEIMCVYKINISHMRIGLYE